MSILAKRKHPIIPCD
uniref:Uncharacterized protein n=1 Tax=Anguilla anguilla TaxID=7936 RepID=A0A0E9PQ09_ANGAN